MPPDASVVKETLEKNFTPQEAAQIQTFYLHSGLSYEKMPFKHTLMMKMFCKMLKKKDAEAYETLRASFDHTSRESLKPLLEYVKSSKV